MPARCALRAGLGRCPLAQGGQGVVGAQGLHGSHGGIKHEDRHNGCGIHPLAQRARDQRRSQQHHHHEVAQLRQQGYQPAASGGLGKLIQAVDRRTAQRFLFGKALLQVYRMRYGQRIGILQMPVRWCAGPG